MRANKSGIWLTMMALAAFVILVSGCGTKVFNDGTYQGISTAGDKGYAVAQVVVEKDKIKSVTLKEITELGLEKDYATYPYPAAKEANTEMASKFAGRSDNQVDTFAGATTSSEQYKEAVGFALEKASKNPKITTTHFDGTFMGRSPETEEGWQVAWVTIENDKITEVRLDDVQEGKLKDWVTYPYLKAVEAKGTAEKAMVEQGTTTVDAVSGATHSSTGWVEAATQAMQNAQIK